MILNGHKCNFQTKSRSISIVKGKVVNKTFFINGEAIPTVSEKPVKSLGRW